MLNVIIPVWHSKETLPKTLDSLVAQTKNMFLVTIVQDCDKEDYSDIIKEYNNRGLHISLIQQKENKGPGVARQAGIDNTKMCDYIMFLDSDDMLNPRAIEILYREAKNNDFDFCASDFIAERKGGSGYYIGCENSPVTWCLGKIYKLKYLRDNNIRFDEEIRLNEDSYFNLVAANSTNKKGKVKECMGIMRDNRNSLTRSDGSAEFFKKSADQYIISQIRGLCKITEVINSIDERLVAMTFINIYNHMMEADYRKLELKNLNEFEKIKNNKIIMDSINTEQFWDEVNHSLRACQKNKEEMFFYKQTFMDWLKEYIVG